ncbi:phosphoribosylaminoimidazolesuccinocarboxamide synthase [Alkalicella caledoniensis]|uniref:Phosphoribosylaminoimidazole-succinocarboxamide synthase n=1 Tax=Alkalicella caledoniensis TaxID=2731377 RepID=A0A7G9W984_ALKCA|nr:phosphoribosylaminoimidazolesuccinocarboxamide synthase [Alkalicella caledoniensis]QNO15246.1 phosphoribosylaminoimidazolesuccinocarboxamide synthase [Alkalicella caledoniensis]
MVTRGRELYQGKAKVIFETEEPNTYWVSYKDSLTAGNGQKKAQETGKGSLNNIISSYIFKYLNDMGIGTHYIKKISDHEMLVKKVDIIPVEVVVRNIAAGSICTRLGIKEKRVLKKPLLEFFYKNDSLGDPLISENHIELMKLATKDQVMQMEGMALAINKILKELFLNLNLKLVDFKLEFGIDTNGTLLLADEVSPDTCRLWDVNTGKSFDKDLFRKDMGSISEGYIEVINRLKGRLGESEI